MFHWVQHILQGLSFSCWCLLNVWNGNHLFKGNIRARTHYIQDDGKLVACCGPCLSSLFSSYILWLPTEPLSRLLEFDEVLSCQVPLSGLPFSLPSPPVHKLFPSVLPSLTELITPPLCLHGTWCTLLMLVLITPNCSYLFPSHSPLLDCELLKNRHHVCFIFIKPKYLLGNLTFHRSGINESQEKHPP